MKRTAGEHSRLTDSIAASGRKFQPTRHAGTQGSVLAPSRMTSSARLSELAGLLALGFRRLRLSSQNQLAQSGETERSCNSVDRHKNTDSEDVA